MLPLPLRVLRIFSFFSAVVCLTFFSFRRATFIDFLAVVFCSMTSYKVQQSVLLIDFSWNIICRARYITIGRVFFLSFEPWLSHNFRQRYSLVSTEFFMHSFCTKLNWFSINSSMSRMPVLRLSPNVTYLKMCYMPRDSVHILAKCIPLIFSYIQEMRCIWSRKSHSVRLGTRWKSDSGAPS